MKGRLALGILLALCLGVALRVPQLNRRPMHNDEAVNALKFRELWEGGRYRYDPNEYHGPTLEYATLATAALTPGRGFNQLTETSFRLVPVGFGLGLILLLPLLADGLGRVGAGCAAVLTAVSPALVFYSRYYIHEMLLVFFSALVLAAAWRYTRSRTAGWSLLTGVGLGLMAATKETFVLALGAMAVGAAGAIFWRTRGERRRVELRSLWNARHAALGLVAGLLIALVLFSSCFTNLAGPLDAVRTYLPWLNRARGHSPHDHSWLFYFHRLLFFHRPNGPIWSEGMILLLAGVGGIAALTRRGLGDTHVLLVRAIAIYTVVLTGVYTVIAYKTPWCALGFWQGTIL
ncbi:MAG: glycosyltransferase family 39 protein, partial [Verrucomicrobia bacterium]|nr:glycosyltransferase family 39 protein [Verrucomicrobiota bacterium]